ncbi:MAG TPA: hypothetical protein VL856_07240 [Acidimicrobiia bacterium]|jgi:hypothetical protein|nr:hypothetical protein [Acidimicrobiia bacterium]
MPVPFPSEADVRLTPPDAEEVRVMVGGVAAAVAPGGELTGLQRLLIDALTESMTGFVVPVNHVPRLTPEQFAHALARRDALFRQRMLQFMLVCALVLVPLPDEVVVRVEEYARELGVSNDMLRVAQRYAHGSLGLALFDFERSGYMEMWDPAQTQSLHTSRALTDAWDQCVLDPPLAAQWAALRELPEGTFGRDVAKFYDARGFTFPGSPNSAPPLLAQHDWMHVLGGYGSTVESELEVFGFISRANDDPRAFSLLAMVISLFETGYLASGAGLFQYDRGHLSHEGMAVRLADAMRRGALVAAHSGGPDLLRIDWFEHADRPLDDVRAEFGVVAKAERAVQAGSVTAWEHGGISPYQYDCGKRAADAAAREYDSYGASPA